MVVDRFGYLSFCLLVCLFFVFLLLFALCCLITVMQFCLNPFSPFGLVPPRDPGKSLATDVDVVCCWCLLSVVKRVNIWLYLPHAFDRFQPKLGHRFNTLISKHWIGNDCFDCEVTPAAILSCWMYPKRSVHPTRAYYNNTVF